MTFRVLLDIAIERQGTNTYFHVLGEIQSLSVRVKNKPVRIYIDMPNTFAGCMGFELEPESILENLSQHYIHIECYASADSCDKEISLEDLGQMAKKSFLEAGFALVDGLGKPV